MLCYLLSKTLSYLSYTIYNEVNNLFVEIDWVLEDEPNPDYAFNYDQIVSVGELLSTKIMSTYLQEKGFKNFWLDARDIIRTNNKYRNAKNYIIY